MLLSQTGSSPSIFVDSAPKFPVIAFLEGAP
jgi:hypothetical protein